MKKLKSVLFCLLLSPIILTLCSCGTVLFSSESEKLESEIKALKDELKTQSALISSLISKSTSDQTYENTDNSDKNDISDSSDNSESSSSADFDYTSDGKSIKITKYKGKMTSVKIPEQIEGKPITQIGKSAFADTEIKSISLPSCLEYIDWFAFYDCYLLETVYIPEKVSEIGYAAFDGCSKRLTIYSSSGSYAERFAKSFGITFSAIS